MKILFVSLGCDKNRVDTEVMLGMLSSRGYSFTDDEEEAEAVNALIGALPELTPYNYVDNEHLVTEARAAYDALSENGKNIVGSNAYYLTLAEERLAELKTEAANADAVIALMDAIGDVDASEACLARITATREAYDALNKEERDILLE